MARSKSGAGPKPPSKKLLGSGSKGTQRGNVKGNGIHPPNVNMLNPAKSGNPDVVQQRNAMAMQGKMEQRQLRKNRSTGLKP